MNDINSYTIKHCPVRRLVGVLIKYSDKGSEAYIADELNPTEARELAHKLIDHANKAEGIAG